MTDDDIAALPGRLRRKYWLAAISVGVPGCRHLIGDAANACRAWLSMAGQLAAGDRVRIEDGKLATVVEPNTEIEGLHLIGRLCTVRRDGCDGLFAVRVESIVGLVSE